MDSDFQFVEPVLSLRSSILHSLLRRTAVECGREASPPVSLRRRAERLFVALTGTLLTQARLAREAGCYQVGGDLCYCNLKPQMTIQSSHSVSIVCSMSIVEQYVVLSACACGCGVGVVWVWFGVVGVFVKMSAQTHAVMVCTESKLYFNGQQNLTW